MSERKRAGFSRLQNMSSYDDLVEKASGDERVLTLVHDGPRFQNLEETKIRLADMHPFPNHPFRVVDDEAMQSLTESIKNRGVIHPAIVRKDGKGGYQIISGHRRRFACLKAGYTDMPAYVIDVTDDEAVIMMADANLYQRETFLPSEKAKVYRQKSDAIKRHSGIKGKYTIDEIGDGTSDSSTQIKRFIRLSYLTDDLLYMVDEKKIGLDPGVQLSYIQNSQMHDVYDVFQDFLSGGSFSISIQQAKEIRKLSEEEKFSREAVIAVLLNKEKSKRKLVLKADFLAQYFAEDDSEEDIKETIEKALKEYYEKGGGKK